MIKRPVIISSLLCCLLFYTGIVAIPPVNTFSTLIENSSVVALDGVFASSPIILSNGDFYKASFKVNSAFSKEFSCSANGKTTVFIPKQIVEALYPGKLFSVSGFDQQKDLPIIETSLHAHVSGYFTKAGFYVDSLVSKGFSNKFSYFRALSRLVLKRLLFTCGDAGALLLALISGSREYTSTSVADSFRNAGLSHILALSGMHLSIFTMLSRFFTKWNKKLSNIFSLFVVLAFVWFAGLSPSLLRALISVILTIIFEKMFVKTDLIGILGLSFLIQICISPSDMNNLGFILSYSALVGLYFGNTFLEKYFRKFFHKKIASDISASVGAQFFTSPITLLILGTCAPIGIIAAVVVNPFATIFLSVGIVGIILCVLCPIFLFPFSCIINGIYAILILIVNFFAKFPSITI